MQQIVFLDSDTLDTGITLRHPDFPHHWQSYPSTAPEQVVERLKDASISIINTRRHHHFHNNFQLFDGLLLSLLSQSLAVQHLHLC